MGDDLTTAYMAGYHKREDEIAALRATIDELTEHAKIWESIENENAALRERVKVLEDIVDAAKELRRSMAVFHTKPDTCTCFVCEFDRRVGRE